MTEWKIFWYKKVYSIKQMSMILESLIPAWYFEDTEFDIVTCFN